MRYKKNIVRVLVLLSFGFVSIRAKAGVDAKFDDVLLNTPLSIRISERFNSGWQIYNARSFRGNVVIAKIDRDKKVYQTVFYYGHNMCSLSRSSSSISPVFVINNRDVEIKYLELLTKYWSIPGCFLGRGLSGFKQVTLVGETLTASIPDGSSITASLDATKGYVATKIERKINNNTLNTISLSKPKQLGDTWIMTNCDISSQTNPVIQYSYAIDNIRVLDKTDEVESMGKGVMYLEKGTVIQDYRTEPMAQFVLKESRLFNPDEIVMKSRKQSENNRLRSEQANPWKFYAFAVFISILCIVVSRFFVRMRKNDL